jgi:hypothetical protein
MSIIITSTNLQTQNVTRGKLSFVDLAVSERCPTHDTSCVVPLLQDPTKASSVDADEQ